MEDIQTLHSADPSPPDGLGKDNWYESIGEEFIFSMSGATNGVPGGAISAPENTELRVTLVEIYVLIALSIPLFVCEGFVDPAAFVLNKFPNTVEAIEILAYFLRILFSFVKVSLE